VRTRLWVPPIQTEVDGSTFKIHPEIKKTSNSAFLLCYYQVDAATSQAAASTKQLTAETCLAKAKGIGDIFAEPVASRRLTAKGDAPSARQSPVKYYFPNVRCSLGVTSTVVRHTREYSGSPKRNQVITLGHTLANFAQRVRGRDRTDEIGLTIPTG